MRDWLCRARDFLTHAFAVEDSQHTFSVEDEVLLGRVANYIAARRMTVPAILFLESMRPLNFVGSQVMVFLQPILASFFSVQDYKHRADILEKRQSIDVLIHKIEGNEPKRQDTRATRSCSE